LQREEQSELNMIYHGQVVTATLTASVTCQVWIEVTGL